MNNFFTVFLLGVAFSLPCYAQGMRASPGLMPPEPQAYVVAAQITSVRPDDDVEPGQLVLLGGFFAISGDLHPVEQFLTRSVLLLVDGSPAKFELLNFQEGVSQEWRKTTPDVTKPAHFISASFRAEVPPRVPRRSKVLIQLARSVDLVTLDESSIRIAEERYFGIPQRILLAMLAAALVPALALMLSRALRTRRIRRMNEGKDVRELRSAPDIVEKSLTPTADVKTYAQGVPPQVPPAIVSALQNEELVLVFGFGVSAQAGLPTNRDLWLKVVEEVYAADGTKEDFTQRKEALKRIVIDSGPDGAIDAMRNKVGDGSIYDALTKELSRPDIKPSTFHQKLFSLPCRVVIDTTWDSLAESAFVERNPVVVTPNQSQGVSEVLRGNRLCILKPMGRLSEPSSLSLTLEDFRNQLSTAPEFARALASLFSSTHFLFLGMSLEGIDCFLATLPSQLQASVQPTTGSPPQA